MPAPLKSYIDRVLNVLAEIDDLGTDKKAIYKELAGDGYDRTVVSQVVGHIRKKAAKPGKFAEQSQLFDLYLADYEGVGTVVATHTPHANHDADGVISDDEPNSPEIPDSSIDPDPTMYTLYEPATHAAAVGGEGGEDAPALSVDTNEPEGSNQSTAAGMDRHGLKVSGLTPAGPDARLMAEEAVATTSATLYPATQAEPGAGTQAPPVDTQFDVPTLASDDEGLPALTAEEADASSATHEAEHSTVSSVDFQREPLSVPVVSEPPQDADAQRPTAGPNPLKWNPEYFDAPHPLCKQPKLCGGNSNIVVCETCRAAASNITNEIQVEAGGVRTPHLGGVAAR